MRLQKTVEDLKEALSLAEEALAADPSEGHPEAGETLYKKIPSLVQTLVEWGYQGENDRVCYDAFIRDLLQDMDLS